MADAGPSGVRAVAGRVSMQLVAGSQELTGTGSLHEDLPELVRAFHVRMATPAAMQLAPVLIGETRTRSLHMRAARERSGSRVRRRHGLSPSDETLN